MMRAKSILLAPPRATRLTPRNILLTFIVFSISTWFIYYLSPAHGWRKPPGREWHPAVYNPPPSLNPPWWTFGFGRRPKTREGKPPPHFQIPTDTTNDPPCKRLRGADDVLVIVKTGATESRWKLPAHLTSTLTCVPHFTVFGDLEETVAGQPVHDALDETTSTIKYTSPDFELYREQLEAQRRGRKDFTGFLDSTETRGHTEDVALDKEEGRALVLDRWKYLPMLEKALERRPMAKWFVFIEADTALYWSNLLQWLGQLNEKKEWYLGGQATVDSGQTAFALGGPGYILSNKALRAAVEQLQTERRRFDRMILSESRGDVVLSKLLAEVQVPLTPASQMFQPHTPASLGYTKHNWCAPVMTFHGLDRDELHRLWDMEQRRLGESNSPTLHRDVFHALVSPFITTHPTAKQWDNLSGDRVLPPPEDPSSTNPRARVSPSPTFTRPITPMQSLSVRQSQAWISPDACAEYCEAETECLQWSYRGDGTCAINFSVKLGYKQSQDIAVRDVAGEGHDFVTVGKRKRKRKKGEKLISGWMMDRIDERKRRWEPCEVKWDSVFDINNKKRKQEYQDEDDVEEERGMR